jgi:chromosomal replication initiator protein
MYLMRKVTRCSYSEIGRELGDRNHATVLHGYNKVLNELAENPRLERLLARVMEQLPSSRTS